jgi:hypothetical protein
MPYTTEEIHQHLEVDDRWLIRGLLAIHARQTADEQVAQATIERNNVGFNGCDAQFLTDIAQKYQKYGRLSDKQIIAVRKCMLKYARQLTKIANKEL